LVKATGGEKEHRLTVNEIPSHSHQQASKYTEQDFGGGLSCRVALLGYAAAYGKDDVYNRWQNSNTSLTGEGQSHNNMPPYYALAYIEYVG
jgi:microcystin-dependent protein